MNLHASFLCPLSPRVCSKPYSLSWCCYLTISSSVIPFSSCLQSFPASRSFPVSQLFVSVGQSIGFSFSISPSNEYSGLISFRMDWVDLLASSSVQSLSRVWLCDSTSCNMPGLPVRHQLLELAQTHVHWVGDAIQPSHPVTPFSSCPQSFPASGAFPMSRVAFS